MEIKSVGTFPVILVKLATSLLPSQTMLNFEQFFGHSIVRGGSGVMKG